MDTQFPNRKLRNCNGLKVSQVQDFLTWLAQSEGVQLNPELALRYVGIDPVALAAEDVAFREMIQADMAEREATFKAQSTVEKLPPPPPPERMVERAPAKPKLVDPFSKPAAPSTKPEVRPTIKPRVKINMPGQAQLL